MKNERLRLFRTALAWFDYTPKSFAEAIKRDKATIYRAMKGIYETKYTTYKINKLIENFHNEYRQKFTTSDNK